MGDLPIPSSFYAWNPADRSFFIVSIDGTQDTFAEQATGASLDDDVTGMV